MPAAVLLLGLPALSPAQSSVITIATPQKVAAKRSEVLAAPIKVELRSGYHVNSNTPSDEYLIPLRLSWDGGPLEIAEIVFPKPKMEKYGFSSKPLSVFTGDFEILTKFKVPASAPAGPRILSGKLRYQACNDNSCLPPRTVEVRLPVEIR